VLAPVLEMVENRASLVAAAREVFAAAGYDAPA
jgi:hypothetical protein